MERRMAILKKVEPILEQAIKVLMSVVDVKSMAKAEAPPPPPPPPPPPAAP
jgi:hypothetical protein